MNDSAKTAHGVTLESRRLGTLTGIKEVIAYSDEQLLLDTAEGRLTITGKELKIGRFSSSSGELTYSGETNMLKYSVPSVPILKRIFK